MTTTGWSGSLFDALPAAPAAPVLDLEALTRGLNPGQREAVFHDDGPSLVLAGAGSGKTRVLTTRIARLIGDRGVAPHEILSVTFTNKAAGEMRARITKFLGHEPKGMWCGTFHALGARLLRGVAPIVGREKNFTIYDEDDTIGAVKRVMERRKLSPAQFAPKAILSAISSAKNALVSPSEYARTARDTFTTAVAGVYTDLEHALQQANAVTFDDLLVLPVRALEQDEALRAHYQRRFKYVLVDEYQDTNAAQFRFVQLIGGGYRNVMVVGDDDQSIYGWRGADIRNILDFERAFSGARIVRLEENYRSTPNILALANAVIAENTERRGKTLRATRPAGETVTLVEALDARDEALAAEETGEDAAGQLQLELHLRLVGDEVAGVHDVFALYLPLQHLAICAIPERARAGDGQLKKPFAREAADEARPAQAQRKPRCGCDVSAGLEAERRAVELHFLHIARRALHQRDAARTGGAIGERVHEQRLAGEELLGQAGEKSAV